MKKYRDSTLEFFKMIGEDKKRFPGVVWFCDKCGAKLNSQDKFDDHHYVWKCTSCGYKNSISKDNILDD